jgi:hypothetical protein
MKRQSIDQLQGLAKVTPVHGPALSRRARLRRWAELLEKAPQAQLRPLSWVEFYAERERAQLRGDNTPIAVAFADPVLRDAGLRGDTLGHAQDFFGLSSAETHYLLCDCHYHGRMDGRGVGKRIRGIADPNPIHRLWTKLCG